jgi:C-terminal peptidase prc
LICAAAIVFAGIAFAGCGSGSDATPTPVPTPTPTLPPTPSPSPNAQGVRFCGYVPGLSEPATMPSDVLHPPLGTNPPTASLPAQTAVPEQTTQRQLHQLSLVHDIVADKYAYPDFNGHDWEAIVARYQALIEGGLSDDDYYSAMNLMISELGDEHSHFDSPANAAQSDAELTQSTNYVGIGVRGERIAGTQTDIVIAVFPGSPAAEAGLRAHDKLLAVDGLPFRDDAGVSRSLGEAGTSFQLTYQRPGEEEKTITMARRAVTGFTPVDYCLVPNTRIGYIMVPTFFDDAIDDQVRTAMEKMTADGPLDGLVIDNRLNGGGSSDVLNPMLGFFTSGNQGSFVSRTSEDEFDVTPEDVGGSQTVPLVILAGPDTVSYGEVFTGVLQNDGRAKVVGSPTAGNVEQLYDSTFNADGARLWLAEKTFQPLGLEPGAWEGKGIIPDVSAPTRWDLFTEATDPALARAVQLLTP